MMVRVEHRINLQ